MLQKSIFLKIDVLCFEKILVRDSVNKECFRLSFLLIADIAVNFVNIFVDERVLSGSGCIEKVIVAEKSITVLIKNKEAKIVNFLKFKGKKSFQVFELRVIVLDILIVEESCDFLPFVSVGIEPLQPFLVNP